MLAVLAFVLAAMLSSASGIWLLERYGAAFEPPTEQEVESPLPRQANAPSAPNGEIAEAGDFGDSGDSGVSLIYQNPELKNGCEATSLAMLLRFYGYSVDKSILAYDYIPREDFSEAGDVRYGPHPGTAYPGDPASSKGFYCYPGPVTEGANRFLAEQGSALQAADISGSSAQELARLVQAGCPVMVWVTLDYGSQPDYLDFTWQLPDGRMYIPYSNLHCVVLSGASELEFQVCDPVNGRITVSMAALTESYQAMGSMAVVIS